MTLRHFLLSGFLVLCGASSGLAQCNSNDPGAPCFAKNKDILNGRRSVLADDDIAISIFNPKLPPGQTTVGVMTTADSARQALITIPGIFEFDAANAVLVRGRLFNVAHDQVMATSINENPGLFDYFFLGSDSSLNQISPSLPIVAGAHFVMATAGDFLGTGFDQIVVGGFHTNSSIQQFGFQTIAAVDPLNESNGITFSPQSAFFNSASTLEVLTSGVFVAPAAGTPAKAQLALLSRHPADDKGLTITFFGMDQNQNITPTGKTIDLVLPEGNNAVPATMAMVAGRFTGGDHDQLVVSYGVASSADKAQIITIDFDAQGDPIQKQTYSTGIGLNGFKFGYYPPGVSLVAAHFDFYSDTAQAAISVYPGTIGAATNAIIEVLSFDANMNPTPGTVYTIPQQCDLGLTVGRFDRMQANPNPPPANQPNANLQLADFSTNCDRNRSSVPIKNQVNIYDVTPANNFAVTLHSANDVTDVYNYLPPVVPGQPLQQVVALQAGDVQGRSLQLGPPDKITVTGHLQPDTVLGVPPMHVDWIAPAGGTTPKVLNVSVFPATFNTAYAFQSGSNATVSRSGTTSFTAAMKETVGGSIGYSSPGIGSVSLKASAAFAQTHSSSVAKKYNTYHGHTSSFTTHTVFDDVVSATSSQLNIYNYRVLGQCVPDATAPAVDDCAAGTRPLYVQFSGPDNINYLQAGEGRNLEWYQPVQEPGQIFSYPANQQQFAADLGGGTTFQPLTPVNNLWDSQTSAIFNSNWTEGGGSSVSAGSTSSHSFDASVSVTASTSILGFSGSVNAGFDYNGSSSLSTLNQSTSSVSSSEGITLNRGVANDVSTYDYQGQSFIYGQLAPQGTIQTDATPPTIVRAQGYIAAAHLADVTSTGTITSGNFWPQAYAQTPDIALNHPQRWLQKTPSGVNEERVQFNCPIGFSSTLDSPACTPNGQAPTPANIADAPFYQMKGLFATPGGQASGPQITSVAFGKSVMLKARVYNYSLANFPSGSTMHVQFYAQPWGIGQFASAPGNPNQFAPAIFIGNGTDVNGDPIVPIPAYCGGYTGGGANDPCVGSAVRNYEYAYVNWDTSKNGVTADSNYKFWVLAWVEDSSGKLVGEIAGHGLKSLPAGPYNSLADVPVDIYSNNLGYYNQVFSVLGATTVVGGSQKPGSVKLTDFRLSQERALLRDQPATLKVTERAVGSEVHSMMTLYFDGDPKHNGRVFDTQNISHVTLDRPFTDTAIYSPKTCGHHELFVRSIPLDGSSKYAMTSLGVEVTIDPVQSMDELITYVDTLKLPEHLRREAIAFLKETHQKFEEGKIEEGRHRVEFLKDELHRHCWPITEKAEKAITEQADDLLSCVRDPK